MNVVTEMNEVLAGAIRTATIKGINFALLREPGTYAQCVFPLPGFSCSQKDHGDLAAYTAETVCQKCQQPLYGANGSGLTKIKTRADVDRLLAELDETLNQELSAEYRSNILATKSAYLGAIGLGPDMLQAAQESYDVCKSGDSAKALANALFVNGRVEGMAPLLEEVFKSPGCAWMDRLHYATSLRYQGRVHEAAAIERENHCAPARFLPYFHGQPCETLHIFEDDGIGDVLYTMRYLEQTILLMESNVSANSFSDFCHRMVFCDIRPKRNHQLIGFTPKDEQVNISHEVRKIFMYFFIASHFGVVEAAI